MRKTCFFSIFGPAVLAAVPAHARSTAGMPAATAQEMRVVTVSGSATLALTAAF